MDLNRYIIAFFLFGFLGWVWESIYCTIEEHKWVNRGFLYGPICPIYGCASLIGFFTYDLIKAGYMPKMEWWMLFIFGFVVSMVIEYPTSWVLEKLFNARWWDYSDIPLNINGRTSVPTSFVFGAAAIFLMNILIPLVDRGIRVFPEFLLDLLALILVSLISVDTTLTISSLSDFQKYVVSLDEAFQNHMANIVERVFSNQNSIYKKAIQRIAVFKLHGRKNRIAKQLREKQFLELIKDYYQSDLIKQMDKHIYHGTTTTLEHCKNVAWISYLINEKLHLNADEKELIEAAMLHDFYFYDWNDGEPIRKKVGLDCPDITCDNAVKDFGIDEKERETIRSHMWPLNITKIPKSKEALIICFADKYCALIERIRSSKYFKLRH
ncbi:MAG: phosphohydrolase [Epulopiscium sp.]|nr:phosphohydrolase [Candidatus Epulonipiscium sp.]